MRALLEIRSSLFADQGESSRLADAYVAAWRAAHPSGRVLVRDLGAAPIPHLDAARVTAFGAQAADRSAAQQAAVDMSDTLIGELQAADEIVLGVPMYNFGIPSTLKAWIDHVARAGITFRYTEAGPVGLLRGKRVKVFASRGGLYAGTPRDTQTTYLRDVLAFLGLDDVEFVYAEGLAIGADRKRAALAAAHAAIARIAAADRAAA